MIIDEIMELLHKMRRETFYKKFEANDEKARDFITRLYDSGQFIYYEPGVVMLGACNPCFFSNEMKASDILLYVDKERRGLGMAKNAVSAFLEWAEGKGARAVTLGQSTGVEPDAFSSVAKSFNMTCIGTIYARSL